MLGTTFSLPLSSGTKNLVKINQDGYASEYLYKDATIQIRMRVRHSSLTRAGVTYDRHNVELVLTTFATDTVPEFDKKAYFVIEQKPSDVDVELMDALADSAIATSNVLLDELFGWQS